MSTGNHIEDLPSSHSLRMGVSAADPTLSWGTKLRDSVSLLDRKMIAPEGYRPPT